MVWAIVGALVVASLLATSFVVYVDDLIPGGSCTDWWVYCRTGTSNFSPGGVEGSVPPGSIGCAPTSGEVCDAASMESALQGLTLAHVRFEVTNASASSTNGPLAPPLPMGAGARVTVLASPDVVAGVWNVSGGSWMSGADWNVPTTGPGVTVILDTGLLSNSTLADAFFWIVLTSPYLGVLGFPLFCAGC